MDRIFREELVELNFKNQNEDKFQVIKEIINDLDSKVIFDVDKEIVMQEVIDREELSTTGFGNNIAIAHAQIEGLKEVIVAIYRFNKDVEWNSLDGEKVKQSFILLIPKEDNDSTHMKILANLARKLMSQKFIDNIKSINDKNELISYLENNK